MAMETIVKECKWLTVGDEDGGEYCHKYPDLILTCVEYLDTKSPFYKEICPEREEI